MGLQGRISNEIVQIYLRKREDASTALAAHKLMIMNHDHGCEGTFGPVISCTHSLGLKIGSTVRYSEVHLQ